MTTCSRFKLFGAGAAALVILSAGLQMEAGAAEPTCLAFVGTYTGPRSQGIYAFRFDPRAGKLTPLGLAAESQNPTFLAIHPNQKFLYAINEVGSPAKPGTVAAYRIEPDTGKLVLLNQQLVGGPGPCHVIVDATGKNVLAANYGGGSIACLPIKDDGSLGELTTFIQHKGSSVNKQRQEGPHAHGLFLDAANRFAFVPDLGLDRVMIYRFDATQGALVAHEPAFAAMPAGAGPRHFAFHPNGRRAYVINELDSTVVVCAYDAERGVLTPMQTIPTLPADFAGKSSCAEIEVHPSGKFVYGSNRGHDSIVVYAADENGKLSLVEHQPTRGRNPRHFAIEPTGRWLLAENQDGHSVVIFSIDPATGRLRPNGEKVEVGSPVCLKFVAAAPTPNP